MVQPVAKQQPPETRRFANKYQRPGGSPLTQASYRAPTTATSPSPLGTNTNGLFQAARSRAAAGPTPLSPYERSLGQAESLFAEMRDRASGLTPMQQSPLAFGGTVMPDTSRDTMLAQQFKNLQQRMLGTQYPGSVPAIGSGPSPQRVPPALAMAGNANALREQIGFRGATVGHGEVANPELFELSRQARKAEMAARRARRQPRAEQKAQQRRDRIATRRTMQRLGVGPLEGFALATGQDAQGGSPSLANRLMMSRIYGPEAAAGIEAQRMQGQTARDVARIGTEGQLGVANINADTTRSVANTDSETRRYISDNYGRQALEQIQAKGEIDRDLQRELGVTNRELQRDLLTHQQQMGTAAITSQETMQQRELSDRILARQAEADNLRTQLKAARGQQKRQIKARLNEIKEQGKIDIATNERRSQAQERAAEAPFQQRVLDAAERRDLRGRLIDVGTPAVMLPTIENILSGQMPPEQLMTGADRNQDAELLQSWGIPEPIAEPLLTTKWGEEPGFFSGQWLPFAEESQQARDAFVSGQWLPFADASQRFRDYLMSGDLVREGILGLPPREQPPLAEKMTQPRAAGGPTLADSIAGAQRNAPGAGEARAASVREWLSQLGGLRGRMNTDYGRDFLDQPAWQRGPQGPWRRSWTLRDVLRATGGPALQPQ